MSETGSLSNFMTLPAERFGKPVCRLGLASHGQTEITAGDVIYALDRGVHFLNWPGVADEPGGRDAFSEAIAGLGERRQEVVICVQLGARTAMEAAVELQVVLEMLRTDYIDIVTMYYVERQEEWETLRADGGVLPYLQEAKRQGRVRSIGVTSHQRRLAAEMARTGLLDVLMIRYNAAHRGAEKEIFPVTDRLGVPVIAYTATRWGALMEPTPEDPPGFRVPTAADWYRFVLRSSSVAVTMAAPHSRAELAEDLEVLRDEGPMPEDRYQELTAHGERVRRYARQFP